MLKRLGIGLLKGLVLGGAVGAALHFGLGATTVGALVGFLVAMGTGAATAVLAGRPPWQKGAWIESLLKGGAGLAVAALLYGLARAFAAVGLPVAIGDVAAGTPWTSVPLVFAPVLAALFGGLIELDNTGDDGAAPGKAKVRVSAEGAEAEPHEVEADADAGAAPGRRRRGE